MPNGDPRAHSHQSPPDEMEALVIRWTQRANQLAFSKPGESLKLRLKARELLRMAKEERNRQRRLLERSPLSFFQAWQLRWRK
jgi:hypothetical protein